MNFDIYQSVGKTQYFQGSLTTYKSLKLVNNILNQFNHQYYPIFLLIMSEIRRAEMS